MDANETLVRERFDTAVGGLTADVVSMVGGGVAVGRGIRRRRRLLGTAGATAAAALVVGVLTATGGLASLFDSMGAGPSGTLTQLQPATPRGLAAAVMAHTSSLGTVIGVGGAKGEQSSVGDASETHSLKVAADIGYLTPTGVKIDLQVISTTSDTTSNWPTYYCRINRPTSCKRSVLPDGSTRITWSIAKPATGPGQDNPYPKAHLLGVVILRRTEVVSVSETVLNSDSAPLSVSALQEIAADPYVGLWTTGELNAKGLDIQDFKNTSDGSGSSSGGTSASASASPSRGVHGSGSGSASRSGPGSASGAGSASGSGSAAPPS